VIKLILLLAVQFTMMGAGLAAETCSGCDQLKTVEVQFRAKNKPSDYYNSLQLKASEIISKMASKKDQSLTTPQVIRVAALIRLSTAVDSSESIINNNIAVIASNKDALIKEFSKLPKPEAESLKKAIENAVDHLTTGDDPTAPPKL
jgi:hypothetical protein